MVFFLVLCFLFFPKDAWAYIDPGYGSYMISSMAAAVMSFFAFVSAFVFAFFRKIWRKHRMVFVAFLLIVAASLVYAVFVYKWNPLVIGNSSVRAPAKFDPDLTGAYLRDPGRVSPGYNLYDGKLIDMQGKTVKTWSSVFMGALDSNGDYYAQKYYQSPVWGRYTWDDKIVWEKRLTVHHQILLTPQGTVITFTKEMHVYRGRKVEFDVILEFDKEGRQLRRFSMWDHFRDFYQYHGPLSADRQINSNAPDDFKKSPWGGNFDYYHLNFLSLVPDNVLKDTNPAFEPGNWVLSFRHGDMIFIVNPQTGKIVWHIFPKDVPDGIQGVHATQMLANGDMIILDNGTYRKWSRIIEWNLLSKEILWEYRPQGLISYTQGYIQVLANGNMLVTESEKGHVFELTRDKKIVWEFYHPSRQNAFVSKVSFSDSGLDADGIFDVLIARGWLKPVSYSEGVLTRPVSAFRGELKDLFPEDFSTIDHILTQYESGKNHEYREEIYRMRRYPVEMVGPLLKGREQ
jgi:Arylsulfotransferase (ASST)